ncbi:MAG: hypothetical protein WCE63_19900 [Acidobacteriaceae bacterium]
MVKQPGVESRLQLSMEPKTSVALHRANVRIENPILLVVNHRVRRSIIRTCNPLAIVMCITVN